MEMHDLLKKTDKELETERARLTAELQALRFSASMSTLKQVHTIRAMRKDRARILTARKQHAQQANVSALPKKTLPKSVTQ